MRFVFWTCLLFLVGWVTAFMLFLSAMPLRATPPETKTDAIVVLTGGSDRVGRGFTMLADGAAPILLISGVGREVTLPEMLATHASQTVRERMAMQGAKVVLGYQASTTETNAQEAAAFVKQYRIRSLRLITADYHMPRAIAEFNGTLNDVEIVPDAVFPDSFKRDSWWKHEKSRDLVLSEYHKCLAVYARRIMPWLARA